MKYYILLALAAILAMFVCLVSDIIWFKFMLWLTTERDNKPKIERVTVTI